MEAYFAFIYIHVWLQIYLFLHANFKNLCRGYVGHNKTECLKGN